MNRAACTATLVVLLIALGVGLALTVPWTVLAGAHPHVDAARDFTRAEIAKEVAFHNAVRPPAYASLVLGLVVAAARLDGERADRPLQRRILGTAGRHGRNQPGRNVRVLPVAQQRLSIGSRDSVATATHPADDRAPSSPRVGA